MSCHFHMLRKRKANEAARTTVEAAVTVASAEDKGKPMVKPEAARTATRGRRKGDS